MDWSDAKLPLFPKTKSMKLPLERVVAKLKATLLPVEVEL